MLSNLDLMALQAETLFRHDAAGRLVAVNEPGDLPAPRLFVGRTTAGNLWRFRHDLPPALVRDLARALAAAPPATDLREPPAAFDRLRDLLEAQAPVESVWMGPAWHFPESPMPAGDAVPLTSTEGLTLESRFAWLAAEVADVQPCLAVIRDGTVVSVCFSARTSPRAAEAGVETLAAHRGRGYATAAVAAWAAAVRAAGRVPLYSTSWDNRASQGVAARLGLVLYGADLHFS